MDPATLPDLQPTLPPLLRFRKASQAVHESQAPEEVVMRVLVELPSALDAEAASVALLEKQSDRAILHAAGPVAESITGLELPPERGIIGWVIANGRSCIVNDVSSDPRFWPDVDGYSGFETQSILCTPLFSGQRVIGAIEVLNKRDGAFSTEDLNFLEAFSTVTVSAIESAYRFQKEQQRSREAEALRRSWEAFAVPRSLDRLLEVVLEQLAHVIEYRSAAILLVTDDGDLELGTSRGIAHVDQAEELVRKLGVDAKVRTMLETGQPLVIADTRMDARWQHFPSSAYIRSWIGAPLLIKGHLIGTLNVDHDQVGYYGEEQVQLLANFAHQAAIAIENTQLYAATHEATLQLAKQARRMVTVYESSRGLMRGLELDRDALHELMEHVVQLVGARYGILNILAQDHRPPLSITVQPKDTSDLDQHWPALKTHVLDMLSSELEVIHSAELRGTSGAKHTLPLSIADCFMAVAVHARGELLGQLLLADKKDAHRFSRDDESLALALATNLAIAIENAALYHHTQQRLHELSALYELSHTVTQMKGARDVYTQLATQVARLLNAERCAFFIYRDGVLQCQPPGYGLPPDILMQLTFPVSEDDQTYHIIQASEPLISNEVVQDPELDPYRLLLSKLKIRRLISCRIPIDQDRTGLLVAGEKRSGEEFTEQDRHLVSILAHQVSSVIQRALLESRQREQTQVQSDLLEVSHAISSLTDLDELLQTVAQVTHRLAGCDHCIIAAWEERHSAFIPRAQNGLGSVTREELSQVHLRPADIVCLDRATETREPVLMSREEVCETVPQEVKDLVAAKQSLLVPLVNQERVVGLIVAAYTHHDVLPGEREIALVTGIARQAAIALENASLFVDLQHHASRLERAYRDLKELDDRKTQFIQNVSHELRTPFTLIKGYLELLLEEEIGTLDPRQKESLAIIAEKTAALGQLIDDIVATQSIDATTLERHKFDLSTLIDSALLIFADAPNVRFEKDTPEDLPQVEADPKLVERALQILLDNAVKFSPDGGVVAVRTRLAEEMLRVEIQDHGIGIPETSLPYLFDRFYQVDGSTTRRFSGTGLGLSMVKQIVEAHGGMVGVRSAENKGSTFFFTLPVASASQS